MLRKVLGLGSVLLLIGVLSAGHAAAWDFTLRGNMEWKYEYYSQLGNKGFFGPYNVDAGGGFFSVARLNGWLGIDTSDESWFQQHPGVVTGADASRAVIFFDLYPTFHLNRAISVHGKYRVAGFEDLNSLYVAGSQPGANNAISHFTWTMLWVSARTPIGLVTYGKRPFSVGCGLQYNGDEDLTQESLMLTAAYGPLRFSLGMFPMTKGFGDLWFDIERRALFSAQGFVFAFGEIGLPNDTWDKSFHPRQLLAMVDYATGPLSMGFGARHSSIHLGPEGLPEFFFGADSTPPLDQTDFEGWLFAKYNNGRLFFNGEVDFFHRIRRYQRSENGTFFGQPADALGPGSGSLFAPEYIDSWRWMIETGYLAGPAKLSLLYAHLPGPDRRHGILIDRQPTTFPYVPIQQSFFPALNAHVGNTGVFRPYSLLLAYDYGAGLNCVDLNGNGSITDAVVFAAKLDYALAANLNVYGSFFYAKRASHGWQWGIIFPDEGGELEFRSRTDPTTEFSNPVPTVPDTSLGWEADIGLRWRLLEGWTLNMTGAYWVPGRWFNYACVDRSVTDWNVNPTAANNWGANPNRSIDPIIGFETRLIAEF